jgi:hypothetical protein
MMWGTTKTKSIVTVTVAMLLLFGVLVAMSPPASQAQSGVTNFTTIKASRDIFAARDIRAARDISAGDDITVTDDAVLGSDLTLMPQTGITLTMNGWLTPTGSLTLIQSAGAVSISGGRIAAGTAGDVLVLLNVGSQTVTFTETTGLVSAGNIALGTLDSATLVYRGSNWYQIAASNN